MFLSCIFLWVPFLYLSPKNTPNTTISSVSSLPLHYIPKILTTETSYLKSSPKQTQ